MNFTVPTIFTAIDAMKVPIEAMKRHVNSFANSTGNAIQKSNTFFKKLTPSLGEAQKQLLSMVSTAALFALVIGGISFSVNSLKDYETAVASFRTIVGGSDKEFIPFQKKILEVARDSKTSSVDTAIAFEKIAGLNAKFAETADSIGAVSKSAITLSKASRDELGSSAESLVGIMNQFNLGAKEADRTINVLAAGASVGASSIINTAESFKNFGSVASSANITLEQSVGLIQTLGKFSVFGAEAGTKLRGSVLKLQQAGVGYKSGQFQINDALAEAKAKVDKLSTAKAKDALLTKMFGAENISTGRILLNNIELYKEFTNGVTGTQAAQAAAAINSNTLSKALDELKAAWVNIITGSDGATNSMNTAKTVIRFVADNLSTIVEVGSKVLLFMIAWKAIIIANNIVQWGWATVQAVNLALQGKTLLFLQGNTTAMAAYRVITASVTAAQWLWNAAVMAFPIILIIAGIVAVIAAVAMIIVKWNEWGAALTAVFAIFMPGLMLIINLVQSFRRNWDMITEAFSQGGILAGLQAIGATLLDSILMPMQQLLEIIAKIDPTGMAAKAAAGLEQFRKDIGVNVSTNESGDPLEKSPVLSTSVAKQEMFNKTVSESVQKSQLDVRFQNAPKDTKFNWGNSLPNVNLSSTR